MLKRLITGILGEKTMGNEYSAIKKITSSIDWNLYRLKSLDTAKLTLQEEKKELKTFT